MFSKQVEKNDIDFYRVYRDSRKSEFIGDKFTLAAVSAVAVSAVVVMAMYGTVNVMTENVQEEIAVIEEFTQDPVIIQRTEAVTQELTEIKNINQYNEAVRLATAKFDTHPIFDSRIFNQIAKAMPSDVEILNINYSQGKVILQCQAYNRLSPADMTSALRKSSYIEEVKYNGFTMNAEDLLSYRLELVIRGEGEMYAVK